MCEYIDDYINENIIPNLKKNIIEDKNDLFNDFLTIIENIDNNYIDKLYIIKETFLFKIDKIINLYKKYFKNKIKLNDLIELQKTIPLQRTKEWYDLRKNILTASSLADAINKCHFNTREELLYDKIIDAPREFNPITEWGVKYEEIATKYYELLTNTKIIEFGLIPHPHFKYFGASPDGICGDNGNIEYMGRRLEIKCPPKRKFTKKVPYHYELQMQGQLEVCDLDECDFFQVKIIEYDNFDDFKNDKGDKYGFTKNNLPKGCVITYKENNIFKYLYPELGLSDSQYLIWEEENIKNIEKTQYIETKMWYIDRYEKTLVKRNKELWINLIPDIYKFCKDLYYYRNNIAELIEIIENNKKNKKKNYFIIERELPNFLLCD